MNRRREPKFYSIFGQIEGAVADSMALNGKVKKIEPYDVPATARYDDDGNICHCAVVMDPATCAEFDELVAQLRA